MTYDIKKAVEAQDNYIKRTGNPHFAPYDGICWKCNKNIYKQYERKLDTRNNFGIAFDSDYVIQKTGITVEEASSTLVTGCPHCNISYCE